MPLDTDEDRRQSTQTQLDLGPEANLVSGVDPQGRLVTQFESMDAGAADDDDGTREEPRRAEQA